MNQKMQDLLNRINKKSLAFLTDVNVEKNGCGLEAVMSLLTLRCVEVTLKLDFFHLMLAIY